MGRNKKEDKKSNIKNKTVKKDIKPIETEKIEEVVVSNESDVLNAEQEQNIYEENETIAETITQEEIQKSEEDLELENEDSLNVDQEQNNLEEKEQEIINTESIDVAETLEVEETPYIEEKAKEHKSKKNTITTNEMFGYNWMGQVYDY